MEFSQDCVTSFQRKVIKFYEEYSLQDYIHNSF